MYNDKSRRFSLDESLRKILVCEGSEWKNRHISVLTEEEKSKVTDGLVTKLFNQIKSKAFDMDFSYIEKTKGDITKLPEYKDLVRSISFLEKIVDSDKKNDKVSNNLKLIVSSLKQSIMILEKHKSKFMIGFKNSNVLVIYLYDSITIALIEGLSITIAEGIELFKDSLNMYGYKVKDDMKPLIKNNYISSIIKFVEMENTNRLSQILNHNLKLTEDVVTASLAVLGSTMLILYLVQSIVFAFFYTRIKIAKYLEHVKYFLEMNLVSINGSDAKKIREKQEKMAKKLGDLADLINVDQTVSQNRANSDISVNNKILAVNNPPSEINQDILL